MRASEPTRIGQHVKNKTNEPSLSLPGMYVCSADFSCLCDDDDDAFLLKFRRRQMSIVFVVENETRGEGAWSSGSKSVVRDGQSAWRRVAKH